MGVPTKSKNVRFKIIERKLKKIVSSSWPVSFNSKLYLTSLFYNPLFISRLLSLSHQTSDVVPKYFPQLFFQYLQYPESYSFNHPLRLVKIQNFFLGNFLLQNTATHWVVALLRIGNCVEHRGQGMRTSWMSSLNEQTPSSSWSHGSGRKKGSYS